MKIKLPDHDRIRHDRMRPLISFTPDNEFKAGSCGRYLKEFSK